MFRKLATLALLLVVAVNAYDASRYVSDAYQYGIGLHGAAYLVASFAAVVLVVRRAL